MSVDFLFNGYFFDLLFVFYGLVVGVIGGFLVFVYFSVFLDFNMLVFDCIVFFLDLGLVIDKIIEFIIGFDFI